MIMIYIYDILLNFCDNDCIYDFYEWNNNDNIDNIKRIKLVYVNKDVYDDIMENKDIVFTHSIPVYTVQLRIAKVENKRFTFESTNADFNMLAKEEDYLIKYPYDKDVMVCDYIKRKKKPVVINQTGRIKYSD